MCLYNYNKKESKYKHLTYAKKTMIERQHNKEKLSTKEIAKLLDKSERTIRKELKRGKTIIKDYLWRDVEVYSADVSHNEYILNLTKEDFIYKKEHKGKNKDKRIAKL